MIAIRFKECRTGGTSRCSAATRTYSREAPPDPKIYALDTCWCATPVLREPAVGFQPAGLARLAGTEINFAVDQERVRKIR